MAGRANNKDDKKQEEYRGILNELLKEPGNKTCADCGALAPRWASATLGIFLCIKCSGIHRAMGTHISFVRSVELDNWKEHEIQKVKETGNVRSNEFWEARVPPGYPRPKAGDGVNLDRYIRDKYESRRFLKKSSDSTSLSNSANKGFRSTPVPSGLQQHPPAHTPPSQDRNNLLVSSDSEFGDFISAPSSSAPPTSKPLSVTPVSTIPSPQPIMPDAKSNIMSMFNLHQQPPMVQPVVQPVMHPTMVQYPYGVPAQGGFYPVAQPYVGYQGHYLNPQFTGQSDILQKINCMAIEKRQQEFAVLNTF